MIDLKIGMIGLDTSHCIAFTKLLNKKGWSRNRIKGGTIKFAYKGGSNLFSKSYNRVDGFSQKLQKRFGVQILDSIQEVAEKADAILLESCDGRQHLEQFRSIAPYKKPVFIDKPMACSSEDAKKIIEISQKENCPVFSASSLRYYSGIREYAHSKKKNPKILALDVFGPAELPKDYPGFYWYGVHIASIIYQLLGTGCKNVKVLTHQEKFTAINAKWNDDRNVNILGFRDMGKSKWGATVYSDNKVFQTIAKNKPPAYRLLLKDVMKFFRTKIPPVPLSESMEMMNFLESINQSLDSGHRIEI